MKLSIVIPVYNEAATISEIVGLVRSVDVGNGEGNFVGG